MARKYSNNAVVTSLASAATDVATTITVASTTGFPATSFILALDPDTTNQELVLVTGVAGSTLTVTRGYDNTTAVAHDVGAVVRHSHAAIDFREPQEHIDATTGVHGVTGDLVGTTNAQVLTNKDLSSATNTFPTTLATDAELAAHAAASSGVHGVADKVVGTTDTQTLTNKTIALGSNTVSGTTAQFNAANTDGDFATLAGAEALTNKDLSSSTNAFPNTLVTGAAGAKVQGGTDTVTIGAADSWASKTITFPTAYSVAPYVVPSVQITSPSDSVDVTVIVTAVTTTGFTVAVKRSNTTNTTIYWIAVGTA